jgi:hypothetical protein
MVGDSYSADNGQRPAALPVLGDNIPAELKALTCWVVWHFVKETDPETGEVDWDKPPRDARTRGLASSTNPRTWSPFDAALAAYLAGGLDGVGFVLHCQPGEDGVIIAIDLDHCRDPQTGAVEPWAQKVIDNINSYTEVSPSGTGIRIFLRGPTLKRGRKKGNVEVYSTSRYVTVTGQHIEGTLRTVESRPEALAAFMAEHFPDPPPPPPNGHRHPHGPSDLDDAEIVCRAGEARNGAKFTALWLGDTSGYVSNSEADLALCSCLAFWCGACPERIDALFRQSGLFRTKWQRDDYRDRTINKALQGRTEYYSPGAAGQAAGGPEDESLWPAALAEGAFHGLAGDAVRLLAPASEADPAALLFQFLVAFGNAVRRGPCFTVEADRHYTNEFLVLVGRTSKSRKGTSWGQVLRLFERVAAGWLGPCVQSGLSSGEGLVWALRDRIMKRERVREKDAVRYEEVEADPGVSDKRLLIFEPEFANVLKQTERQGNILSAVLRQAWDRGDLSTLTKNSPARATGAHVSFVGHVTAEELRRYLSATEIANGLGNRFLWACVRRSKQLPKGGSPDPVALAALQGRVAAAVSSALTAGRLAPDDDAWGAWCAAYGELSEGKPGLVGALLGRAEAHVMRLALLYAILDGGPSIRKPHLLAALDCWRFVEASTRYIFGDSTGDPLADDLLRLLRTNPAGLTRTELSNYLGRNQTANRIGQALGMLLRYKLARCEKEMTGKRTAERWFTVEK